MTESRSNKVGRWIRQLLLSVVAPVLVAVIAGSIAANRTLSNAQRGGQAIYDSVGIRYFAQLYNSVEFAESGEVRYRTGAFESYRAVLEDLVEDLRFLRTTPTYADVFEGNAQLALLQNSLAVEAAGEITGINEGTLQTMCRLYVQSPSWQATAQDQTGTKAQDQIRTAAIEAGKHFCEVLVP